MDDGDSARKGGEGGVRKGDGWVGGGGGGERRCGYSNSSERRRRLLLLLLLCRGKVWNLELVRGVAGPVRPVRGRGGADNALLPQTH